MSKPEKGETILICAHYDEKRVFHWFHTTERSDFTRPDGSEGDFHWIAICEECFAEYDDITRAIRNDIVFDGRSLNMVKAN